MDVKGRTILFYVAKGSEKFVEKTKQQLGIRAMGRKVV
jgi:hypothetical protein